MKLQNHSEALGGRLRVRAGLAERDAAARRDESTAHAAMQAIAAELEKAHAAYEKAPTEPSRLRLRELGARLGDAQASADAAAGLARQASHALRQADSAIGETAGKILDPALVRAASAATAAELLDPETAKRWAAGDVQLSEAKRFVEAVAEHCGAVDRLRAAGVSWPYMAPELLLLPLLEAWAAVGRAPMRPMGFGWTTSFPMLDRATVIKTWVEERSEGPLTDAEVVASVVQMTHKIRAFIETHDVRSAGEIQDLELEASRAQVHPIHVEQRQRLDEINLAAARRKAMTGLIGERGTSRG